MAFINCAISKKLLLHSLFFRKFSELQKFESDGNEHTYAPPECPSPAYARKAPAVTDKNIDENYAQPKVGESTYGKSEVASAPAHRAVAHYLYADDGQEAGNYRKEQRGITQRVLCQLIFLNEYLRKLLGEGHENSHEYKRYRQRIDKCYPKALSYSSVLPRRHILRSEVGKSVGHIAYAHSGHNDEFESGRKARGRVLSYSVYAPVHKEIPDGDKALLQNNGNRTHDEFFYKSTVEKFGFLFRMNGTHLPYEHDYRENAGDCLGNERCPRRARHVKTEHAHEQQVEGDVQCRGYHEEYEGHFTVAERSADAATEII